MFWENGYASSRYINIIPAWWKIGQVLAKKGWDTLNNEWIDLPAWWTPNITSWTVWTDKFFWVNWSEAQTLWTDKKLEFSYNPTFNWCVQMFVDKRWSTSSADYWVAVNLTTKDYVDKVL